MNKQTTKQIVIASRSDLVKAINNMRKTKSDDLNIVNATRLMMQAHSSIIMYLRPEDSGYQYPIADYTPST